MSDVKPGVSSVRGTAWSTAAAGLLLTAALHLPRPVVAASSIVFYAAGRHAAIAAQRRQEATPAPKAG